MLTKTSRATVESSCHFVNRGMTPEATAPSATSTPTMRTRLWGLIRRRRIAAENLHCRRLTLGGRACTADRRMRNRGAEELVLAAATTTRPARSLDEAGALAAADDLVAAGSRARRRRSPRRREPPGPRARRSKRASFACAGKRSTRSLRSDARPGRRSSPTLFPDVVGRTPAVARGELTADGARWRGPAPRMSRGARPLRPRAGHADVGVRRSGPRARRDDFLASAPGAFAPDEWYRPFPTGETKDEVQRRRVAGNGGTWLADSPAATAQVLDDLVASGAIAVVGRALRRPPALLVAEVDVAVLTARERHHRLAPGRVVPRRGRAGHEHLGRAQCLRRRPPDPCARAGAAAGRRHHAHRRRSRFRFDRGGERRTRRGRHAADPSGVRGRRRHHVRRALRAPHVPHARDAHARYALECWLFAPTFAAEPYTSLVV